MYTVPVTVTDKDGGTDTTQLKITVIGTNDAAAISGEITGSATEDSLVKASGTLSISDIISAYILSPRKNKKTRRLYLRGFKPETLYKLRLSHYLLAGFLFSTALRFCFNHRYNKQQFILWEIDHTESKKLILKNLAIQEIVVSIDKGKDTKGHKHKRR